MKILVVNGDFIQKNSSANLCHLAYIRGLVDSGHEVTLLSADGRDYESDPSMVIPKEVEQHTYYSVSFYEKFSMRKKSAAECQASETGKTDTAQKEGVKARLVKTAKQTVRSLYGVHEIYAKFVKKAQAFRSDKEFDYILSLSTPAASHLLVHNLLKAGHIKGKIWIQIWEDPWYSDVYGFSGRKKIYREEKRLLSFAQRICYVSPLTLKKQQKLFPQAAEKMYWQPLPCYYENSSPAEGVIADRFGYFGDYSPSARNLEPFYLAAKEMGVSVCICGNPKGLFEPDENIRIYPRLTLDELKPIEDTAGVLVFLCNRQGGQIPGKIYQYSATNKTILFILDGTDEEKQVLKEFFGKFGRYVFCDNTKEDIMRAMTDITSGNIRDVENKPIADFYPGTTIKNILEGGM